MPSFKSISVANIKSNFMKPVCIILIVCFLSSCQSSSLKFAPVVYDKTSISALLADTSFGYLLLQFNSKNGNSADNPFKLLSYSYKIDNSVLNSSPYNLGIAPGSTAVTFADSLIMGNQRASRDDLTGAITDPSTMAVVNYDYVLFTPALDSANHYVYYLITAEKNTPDSSFVKPQGGRTQPCPPAICQ
ncbi:MAG: hypothetical protein ABI594_01035 [Ginsengibacter sp.]